MRDNSCYRRTNEAYRQEGRGYAGSPIIKIGGRVFRKVRQDNGEIRLVREQHKFNGHFSKPWGQKCSQRPSKKMRRRMKDRGGRGYFRHKPESLLQGNAMCKKEKIFLPEDDRLLEE